MAIPGHSLDEHEAAALLRSDADPQLQADLVAGFEAEGKVSEPDAWVAIQKVVVLLAGLVGAALPALPAIESIVSGLATAGRATK